MTTLLPLGAVTAPPQFVAVFAGDATITAAGMVSVNDNPVKVMVLCVLTRVMVRREVCPEAILVGANCFWTPTPCKVDRVADVASELVNPWVVEIVLEGIVLVRLRNRFEVTLTETVQVELIGTDAPAREILLSPGTAVTTPPEQVVAGVGVA